MLDLQVEMQSSVRILSRNGIVFCLQAETSYSGEFTGSQKWG